MHFRIGRSAVAFTYQRRFSAPDYSDCLRPFSPTDRISSEQRNVRRKNPALFRPAQAAG